MSKALYSMFVLSFCFSAFALELGQYNLKVNINNRMFNDVLVLSRSKDGKVEGEFIVPKVFKSNFKGSLKTINNYDHLIGTFYAKENGGSFLVRLEANFFTSCEIKGQLYQGSHQFAEFQGKHEVCDE